MANLLNSAALACSLHEAMDNLTVAFYQLFSPSRDLGSTEFKATSMGLEGREEEWERLSMKAALKPVKVSNFTGQSLFHISIAHK